MALTAPVKVMPKGTGYRSIASLQSHILVVHDGGARMGTLNCEREGCTATYYSRAKYNNHKRHCKAPIEYKLKRRRGQYHWTHRFRNELDIHSFEDLAAPFERAPPKRPVDDVSRQEEADADADACVEERSDAHPGSDFDHVSSCDTQSLDVDLWPQPSADVDEPSHEGDERLDEPLDEPLDKPVDEPLGEPSDELLHKYSSDHAGENLDEHLGKLSREHAVERLAVNPELAFAPLRPEPSSEVDEPFGEPSNELLQKHLGDHSGENLDGHLDKLSREHAVERFAVNPELTFAPRQSAIVQEAESAAHEQSLIEHTSESTVTEQSLRAHAIESTDTQDTKSTNSLVLVRGKLLTSNASTINLHSLVNGFVQYIGQPSSDTGLAVLLKAASAKRREDDPITLLRSNKKHCGQVSRSALQKLGDALTIHPFGKLLRIDQYVPMEPNLFLSDMHSHGEDVAKTLAGSLLQSGSTVILIIRVELYGRLTKYDVHGFKSARPTWDLKEVKFVCHNNHRKLLIGTSCWNAIVTASINLTSGDISVGIDNPSMRLLSQTRIWTRKDCALNPLLMRPLDNNGQHEHEGGLSKRAAMFYLFIDQKHLPLTVCRGFNNGCKKRKSVEEEAVALRHRVTTCGGNGQVEKMFVDGGFTTTKAFDDRLVQDSIRKTVDLLLHDGKGKARAYYR
ncbi:hypothetical protein BGZ75_002031 [Mortierella antarctica]|nr:hypothetical protein BGZ75_002031 [Mortierella antarctica]